MSTENKDVTESTGRPSKYEPRFCEEIVTFMQDGLSVTSFAATIGVHRDSIYEWAKIHEDFSDALKRACAGCQMFWEKLLIAFATGQQAEKASLTAVIFALKNRGREDWAERIATEFRGKDGQPIDPEANPFTALEIARRIAFLLTEGDRAITVLEPPQPQPLQH